jgi:hypothetical protein
VHIGGQVGVILKPTRKPGNSCFVAGVQYTLTGEYCTPHPMYVEIDSFQGCSIVPHIQCVWRSILGRGTVYTNW